MRPVNKGTAPKVFSDYKEAEPFLEDVIGQYCSYCEMPISNAPEVEHIVSKSKGGSWTDWSNLLLSCKYCNTRKATKVTVTNKSDYLWPDENNTQIAFDYSGGRPKVNEAVLNDIDSNGVVCTKAHNLYDLVDLGNISTKKRIDRRVEKRMEALNKAEESLANWLAMKNDPQKEIMKNQIVMTALCCGFFSIWHMVFDNEPEMLVALVDAFVGTQKKYYNDTDGKTLHII